MINVVLEPTPQLWIIAGPNGSGKSTAYSLLAVESPKEAVWIINPDILAKRICQGEDLPLLDANLKAVERIETWLYASIEAYQTIGVETVLSSDKYRKLVTLAKTKGFKINLIYVFLDSLELHIERVTARVKKGGHNVEHSKIKERRLRSFEQLKWFFGKADTTIVVNNSGASPEVVARKDSDGFSMSSGIINEMSEAMLSHYPELQRLLNTSTNQFKKPSK